MTSKWRGFTRFDGPKSVVSTCRYHGACSAGERLVLMIAVNPGGNLRDRVEVIAYSTLIIIAIVVVMLAFTL
jgi:hypothetical protein